jgi:hypothetical protein
MHQKYRNAKTNGPGLTVPSKSIVQEAPKCGAKATGALFWVVVIMAAVRRTESRHRGRHRAAKASPGKALQGGERSQDAKAPDADPPKRNSWWATSLPKTLCESASVTCMTVVLLGCPNMVQIVPEIVPECPRNTRIHANGVGRKERLSH